MNFANAVAWCKRNRIALGAIVTTVAGIAHVLAPGSHADLVLAIIGTNLTSAGLFKSDIYHRDKQLNGESD